MPSTSEIPRTASGARDSLAPVVMLARNFGAQITSQNWFCNRGHYQWIPRPESRYVIHVVALSKPARKETPPTDQPPQHDAKHHPRRHQTTTRTKAPKTKWLMRHDKHDTLRQTWPKQQQRWLMRHGDTLRNHDDNMMIFVVWRNHGGKRHRELKHERKLCPTHHLKSRWDRVLEQGRTETVPTIRMED